jgi:hypothetical protein
VKQIVKQSRCLQPGQLKMLIRLPRFSRSTKSTVRGSAFSVSTFDFLFFLSIRLARCFFLFFSNFGIFMIFYNNHHFYQHLFEILALEQLGRSKRSRRRDIISFIAWFARYEKQRGSVTIPAERARCTLA